MTTHKNGKWMTKEAKKLMSGNIFKPSQLGKIGDNRPFKLSIRRGSPVYEVDRKEKGVVFFTSKNSERTFKALRTLKVYPV